MRSAFDHYSRCVALSQQHGFGRIEVANRAMVGFSRIYLNEVPQAKEDGDAATRAAALVGQPRAELIGEALGAFACYEHGDFDLVQGYLDRMMRLVRQLGVRRFEAGVFELQARVLLDTGRRAEATEMLREALAMSRKAGMQFEGPKIVSALSRAEDDPVERATLLAEGKEILRRGAVGHNHLWFYRDAIEALLSAGDGAGALEYVAALEDFTRAEPLPWSDLFAKRGRLLARALQGIDEDIRAELTGIRSSLERAGFKPFLPLVNAALDKYIVDARIGLGRGTRYRCVGPIAAIAGMSLIGTKPT
jgi:hypothetical protein